MSRDRLDLRPLSGAVWRASDDAAPVLIQQGPRALLAWTPDRATLRALAEIRTLRIELRLAAPEGKSPDVLVEADWGGGYGEDSRARLKAGGEDLFTVLPARGRRIRLRRFGAKV